MCVRVFVSVFLCVCECVSVCTCVCECLCTCVYLCVRVFLYLCCLRRAATRRTLICGVVGPAARFQVYRSDVVMPFGNTHNKLKMNFSAEQEFPDLSQHNNHMAKVITPDMYANLRDKETPSGFTLDDVIQTGVDNPGNAPSPPRPPLTLPLRLFRCNILPSRGR